ncbi:MAG: lipid-A-disaccharide synthase [Roseibacillus sp.]|jgi:lipid-A-disaccharide synthase|nr:lipid-A-disaccharide synthase [Roseibacillus sp.]
MAQMLYFVAGEHSGDIRAAELIKALQKKRPDWRFSGLGGPRMQGLAGSGLTDWVEDAAVLGLWEVLKRYRWFKQRFEETRREIEELKPDAVVFVDYPGFNLRLAKALSEKVPFVRRVYYISPQVWAWNKGRIRGMATCLDLMLCLFPFEAELFQRAGLPAVCMGHPMVEQLETHRINQSREENLIALFPGSRANEISRIFPLMVKVVADLHERFPDWKFEAAAASLSLESQMREIANTHAKKSLPLVIKQGGSHELMQRAWCGVVTSGTATLEASYYGLPYCLVYKVAWPTYLLGRSLIDIEFLGLANILAGREIVHEFIQHEANVGNVSSFLEAAMTDASLRREIEGDLQEVSARLGSGGAAEIAAGAVVDLLDKRNNED